MSFLESAKTVHRFPTSKPSFPSDPEGDSARELGVRVLYNMPVPTTIQLWDGQRNVLRNTPPPDGRAVTRRPSCKKTISLGRVKADWDFRPPTISRWSMKRSPHAPTSTWTDLTGTELEQAETALFKQAVAESIRATMWVGDTSAASGYNTSTGSSRP